MQVSTVSLIFGSVLNNTKLECDYVVTLQVGYK